MNKAPTLLHFPSFGCGRDKPSSPEYLILLQERLNTIIYTEIGQRWVYLRKAQVGSDLFR